MVGIYTLQGTLLVFRRLAPGDGLGPVQVGRHGVAVFVDLYLEGFVTAERGVGQAFADDAVAHPFHKLPVHGVRHLCLVHPETVDADFLFGNDGPPQGIVVVDADFQESALHFYHSEGYGLHHRRRALSRHLTAVRHGMAAAHTRIEGGCHDETEGKGEYLVHFLWLICFCFFGEHLWGPVGTCGDL